MSIVEPGSARAGLVDRVRSLLFQPKPTWEAIDTEPASIGGLYTGYVAILAAIGPLCVAIGLAVFGVGAFGITVRPSIVSIAVQAVVSYVLGLAMVYVLALIIDGLAPNFGGTKNQVQAFKVAAYAPTASWVAGVFALYPPLAIAGLLGALYSLYLLYLGLPRLMKAPEDKAVPYTAVVIVVAIVVGLVIGMASAAVSTAFGGGIAGAMAAREAKVSGTVNIPGQGSVDLGKLQEASKRMEALANQTQSGNGPAATDPEVLKAYLPASIAGYARGDVSSSSGGAAGMNGSQAEASYTKGEAHMRLEVTDLGGAAALAGMASAFNVKHSEESGTRYEKVGQVNGRMTQESYDRQSKHGEYSVLVGQRFMVQAEGDGVSIDELKAAVGSVDFTRLEGLAKAG